MGRIGIVVDITAESLEGDTGRVFIKVDMGDGETVMAPLFVSAGLDVSPMVGDYVLLSETPGGDGYAITNCADNNNASISTGGMTRIYSRDDSGIFVSELIMGSDGSIKIRNDKGYIELKSNGRVSLNDILTVEP